MLGHAGMELPRTTKIEKQENQKRTLLPLERLPRTWRLEEIWMVGTIQSCCNVFLRLFARAENEVYMCFLVEKTLEDYDHRGSVNTGSNLIKSRLRLFAHLSSGKVNFFRSLLTFTEKHPLQKHMSGKV